MYVFPVPGKYLEKLVKIREEYGIPIARQIRLGIEDFLLRYENPESDYRNVLEKIASNKNKKKYKG